jgi:secretion/DNA translocation related CpaE-like protein
MVGILPGSGGSGASTLAVAIALRAAATRPVTLVDADPAGGGLELLLGAERVEGLRWPDLADVRGVVASRALDEALPQAAGVRVVSHTAAAPCDVPPEAMTAVVSAARRHAALVVVDLPRRLTGASEVVAAACDVVVLVASAEVRAVAAAALALHVAARAADVRLVVRAPARSRLRPAEVGAALGVPVLATIPFVGELPAAADRGDLSRVLGRSGMLPVADLVLAALPEPVPVPVAR